MGSTFILLLQLAAPQILRKVSPSSDLLDEKTKNLLNEDTSKEGSVSDIDSILLGPQHTAGSATLQLRAFFTAYIRFLFPGPLVVLLCSH